MKKFTSPLIDEFSVVARFNNEPDPVTGLRGGFTDAPSRLYWMLCNQPAGVLARRNILALFCSFDAQHWLCAGYPVIFPQSNQAASYVTPLPDGEDLLIVSRTAWQSKNNHDNDLVTFHRLPEFRALAAPFNMQTVPPGKDSAGPNEWQAGL